MFSFLRLLLMNEVALLSSSRDHAAAAATDKTKRYDDDCSSTKTHTHTHTELTVLHCSLINSDRRDAVVTAAAAASLCTIALPAISNWNSSSSIQNKAEPMTFDDGPLSTASSALLLLIPRGAANCCCPPALWLISLSGNSALVSTSQSVSLCWTVLSAWDLLFFHASKLCGDFFFHCDALVLVFSCVSIFSFLYILFKSVNSDDHKASEIKLI